MKYSLSPKVQLYLSVLMGLVAALLAHHVMNEKEKILTSRYQMTTVLVAKRFIPAGKTISAENLEEIKIPIQYREPKSVSCLSELEGPKGGAVPRALIGILKGEQITHSKLTDARNHVGLSWSLPAGRGAFSLKFSADESVAGFVKPGDWVSVYGVKDRGRLLIPRLQVMAVKNHLEDVEDNQNMTENNHAEDTSPILTFAVTPTEAATLVLASERGKIHLALLPALDDSAPDPVSVTPAELGM